MRYCDWGGSSSGARDLLKTGKLNTIGQAMPFAMFEVVMKHGAPSLTFHYNSGKEQEICVANLDSKEIEKKITEYGQRSGADLFKFNHKVMSINDSVRGIWSPMQIPKSHRHKI